jgi:hypothetical protein
MICVINVEWNSKFTYSVTFLLSRYIILKVKQCKYFPFGQDQLYYDLSNTISQNSISFTTNLTFKAA